MAEYPTVMVSGGPRERGRQYGEAARERVRRSVALYEAAFAAYAGWDWQRVRAAAVAFVPVLEPIHARELDEMRGIAEGAVLDFEDVLAINVRTEIMFGAVARDDATRSCGDPAGPRDQTAPIPRSDGCSAVALLPPATPSGHTLLAQNWDWIEGTRETVVVLVARPDDAPAFVTAVEAGLLAKAGMNACGVGVATNSLVSGDDRGTPGVPYHVCLRSILEATSAPEALRRLLAHVRSSSANYLVASGDGLAFDAESRPGDHGAVSVEVPQAGRLFHTNHFISPRFHGRDVGLQLMYDSPFRLQRLQARLGAGPMGDAARAAAGGAGHASGADRPVSRVAGAATVPGIQAALRDHAGHPLGVCAHPDASRDAVHQEGTILSVVMDLTSRRLWLADGNPCVVPYRELPAADWLGGAPREA